MAPPAVTTANSRASAASEGSRWNSAIAPNAPMLQLLFAERKWSATSSRRSLTPEQQPDRDIRTLVQHTDHGAGNAGRKRSGDDGFPSQGNDLVAAFGRHGRETSDHDAQAAEIGEAAQRIGHHQAAAVAQRVVGKLREIDIGEELV